MTRSKTKELQELEKLSNRIEKQKARLEAQLKAEKETSKWYDQVLKESEFKRPRDFVKALMEHFGIRSVSLTKGTRGPGRPPKAELKGAGKATSRRKRTTVSAELRDKVKVEIGKGTPRSTAAKKHSISYPVVKKIEDGAYDHL